MSAKAEFLNPNEAGKPIEVSRRQFTRSLSLAATIAAMAGPVPLAKYLVSSPSVNPSATGVEAGITTPFITTSEGPLPFAIAVAQASDPVRQTTVDFFKLIEDRVTQGRPFALGEMTEASIRLAQANLEQKNQLEAVHVASYADFLATSAWVNKEELRKLGVIPQVLPEETEVDTWYWGKPGLKDVLPEVFSTTGHDEEPLTRHFFAHMFVSTIYLGAQDNHSQTLLRSKPNFLSIYERIRWTQNPPGNFSEQTLEFSDDLGLFYKLSEMKDPRSWPIPGRIVTAGVLDDRNPARFAANHLGTETAIALHNLAKKGQSLSPVFERLNDPKFTYTSNYHEVLGLTT